MTIHEAVDGREFGVIYVPAGEVVEGVAEVGKAHIFERFGMFGADAREYREMGVERGGFAIWGEGGFVNWCGIRFRFRFGFGEEEGTRGVRRFGLGRRGFGHRFGTTGTRFFAG
jgi:hypothetical protein